jgi:CelD/BcsL family acetyltransferase involved in cellulose biosynthesis
LLDHSEREFSAMLFCLYIGDRLAAARLGIRSGGYLHDTLHGYNRELSKFSPGSILLVRMAKAANSLGITRIDLGKGPESFKAWYASGYEQVTEGAVHAQPLHASLYRKWFRAQVRLRSTPLRGAVGRVRRWMLLARTFLGYTK